MGEPVAPPGASPQPVHNVPTAWALAHATGPVVVRATTAGDVPDVSRLDATRLVAVEVPLHLAAAAWPDGVPIDVVLQDPAREAASLYALHPIARQRPVRVTIPGRPGLAKASKIAMALQLPVRLLALQPSPEVLTELEDALEVYLHGAQTSAPVEFFQSALAWWLHGDAPPAWVALEWDPDWFPRIREGATAGEWPPPEPGFAQARLARLVQDGAECEACRFRQWCGGFFKWPDRDYECDGVMGLLARVEESAGQLSRDLDEARALEP